MFIVPALDLSALCVAASIRRPGRLSIGYAICAFVILRTVGARRTTINPLLSRDLPKLLTGLAVPTAVAVLLTVSDARIKDLIPTALLALVLVPVARAIAYELVRKARARGLVVDPTLIVGAGVLGARVARILLEHPEFGLCPIGFLDSFDADGLPYPILGDPSELESTILQYGVTRVIVAFGAIREPEMVPIIRTCDRLPVEMYVLPRFFELGVCPESRDIEEIWGIPLMRLHRSALRGTAWRAKRIFDLVGSALLILLTAPMLVAAAVAVRSSSPGPILFRQKRVGQRGKVFELMKFRTMRDNGDSDTTWSVADDERVTSVGRILRRTSLDELPQLFNVLRGEMSLVGPRPERPHFANTFRVTVQAYDDRHRVPVGVTGWAQVHGLRGDTSIQERAVFDNYYVEHWSMWKDIVILARTVVCVFRGIEG